LPASARLSSRIALSARVYPLLWYDRSNGHARSAVPESALIWNVNRTLAHYSSFLHRALQLLACTMESFTLVCINSKFIDINPKIPPLLCFSSISSKRPHLLISRRRQHPFAHNHLCSTTPVKFSISTLALI
jgi:hypothetical protein